jgi:hypothetical protein
MQLEVTFTDTGAFLKPWSFTVEMTLAADTEMLEAVCERSSDAWAGSLSDATNQGVKVPAEVLARYVGVYRGIYGGGERTYEVTVSNGELFAKILGPPIEGGLGAAGLDDSVPRPLVPQSQTVFEGLGLGYQFVPDEKGGPAIALIVIHISGPYRYSRIK